MRRLAPTLAAAALALVTMARPAAAQPREPLGGWVVDARLVSASLPAGAGWTPPLSTGSVVPGRGFGGAAAADVLLGRGRHRRLSVGASGFIVQGRATSTNGATTVTTRMLAGAPHVAMNFGHRDGWSYLSLGAGGAEVTANAVGVADDPGGLGLVIHYGGGARWFVRDHVAVSLDLRFWALTPRPASSARVGGAATTRVVFSAGLGVR